MVRGVRGVTAGRGLDGVIENPKNWGRQAAEPGIELAHGDRFGRLLGALADSPGLLAGEAASDAQRLPGWASKCAHCHRLWLYWSLPVR